MPNRIVTKDNYKIGDKVVLNKQTVRKADIHYFKTLNVVYSIIERTRFGLPDIVDVSMFNHKGICVGTAFMFIGHANSFELCFYEQ